MVGEDLGSVRGVPSSGIAPGVSKKKSSELSRGYSLRGVWGDSNESRGMSNSTSTSLSNSSNTSTKLGEPSFTEIDPSILGVSSKSSPPFSLWEYVSIPTKDEGREDLRGEKTK